MFKSQSQFVADYLKNLQGKLLTIAEASFPDKEQREAVKSLIRESVWNDFDRLHARTFGGDGLDQQISLELTAGNIKASQER